MPNWRKYTETRLKVLELLAKCMNKRSYQFIMILRVDSYEMTFQSITAMPRYKTLSAEELRIANCGWDPATAVSIAEAKRSTLEHLLLSLERPTKGLWHPKLPDASTDSEQHKWVACDAFERVGDSG